MIADEHTEGRMFMALCICGFILTLVIALVAALLIPEWDAGWAIFSMAVSILGLIGGVMIGMILAPRKVQVRDGSCTVKRNDAPYTVTPYAKWRQLPQSREVAKR